ncbi:MAG: hypothetical protein FJ398_26615 [Verrucomicrobia bacterium]|nr:hypothetical protein [Verrucomicrobiota bacterium]
MGLPFIIGGLLSTHVATQWLAGRELEKFGPAGKAAIPALAENLSSWPWWISRTAIAVPGNHGPDAAAAVPALEKILQTTSQSALGAQAAVALGQINSPNTNALALVSAALDAGPAKTGVQTFISREHALQALAQVRAFEEPFVPILVNEAERERAWSNDTHVYLQSVHILKRIAPQQAIEVLHDSMRNDPREIVRANATGWLLQLQRTNEFAVAALCETIRTNFRNRTVLILHLREASPRSRLAVQTLQRLAAANDLPSVREMARKALGQMQRREALLAP